MSATLDSQGRIWLLFSERAPMLFASSGAFLREVGRIGDGPGEFQRPWRAAAVGDSVIVFDQLGAVTVLGPNLQQVRTALVPPYSRATGFAMVSWPGTVLAAAVLRDRDRAGWPLHFVNFSTAAAQNPRSFGGDGVVVPEDRERILQGYATPDLVLARVVAARGPSAVFAVTKYTDYVVTRWDTAGRMLWELRRDAALFPKKPTWTMGSSRVPPDSRMAAAWYDGRRYLWTFAHVAAPDWQEVRRAFLAQNPPVPPPPGSGRATRSAPASQTVSAHSLYHTLIEVIDVESRTLVASRRYPGYVVSTLPDGRVIAYRESADGVPYVDIVATSLQGGR
jgi:hypothetical protein